MKCKSKIIVILGPTASGKSNIAIKLAKKFNGEIISADSRQIYRKMNIGSGKVTEKEQKMIKHWMLDIIDPKTRFSAAQFKKKLDKIILDILKRQKLPIICGGTGFWIKSIVDDIEYPKVKPNWKLRKKLINYPVEKLFRMLKKMDPRRSNDIDKKNKVRLIRAIEVCKKINFVPPLSQIKENSRKTNENKNYQFLQIGLKISKEKLHKNIKKRLKKRFKLGMIEEVKNLHYNNKISWKRLEEFGLEYRWIAKYLQNKISKNEMEEHLLKDIQKYAKRQLTWFKKDPRIKWIEEYKNIEKEITKFIKK